MRIGELLVEEVFSSLAIAYHRTRNLTNTKAIGESGFKAGDRGMYGKGVYLTYSFDDQQEWYNNDETMIRKYGPFVIRSKVNLSDFLIFDEDVAAKVYGPKYRLQDQFAHFGIPLDKVKFVLHLTPESNPLTATRAKRFANWLWRNEASIIRTDIRFKRPIKGLVFTGAHDGRVIVAYDASSVIPFAWARVTDPDKTRDTVKWNRIAAPPMAKPTVVMPEFERAYRFFREQGFGLVSRGSAGATLVGIRHGDYITITITNGLVKSFVTRHDPVLAAKKYPGYCERLGERLFYQNFNDVSLPLRQIADTIYREADTFRQRPEVHVRFTEALLPYLLKPGFAVQRKDITGADYRADKIMLTAGSIRAEIDMPYYAHTAGKIWITAKPYPVELGFNDGTVRHGGNPDLDTAYGVLLQMVLFSRGAQFEWPADLQPKFVADLQAELGQRR